MIQFEVVNPAITAKNAPQNVLYVGDKNTLKFIFSEIVKKNSDNSDDSTTFNKGDVIKIMVGTGLLDSASDVQMATDSNWSFKYEKTSTDDVFELTALATVTIAPLEQCTITLNEVQLDNLSTNFVFSTQYVISGRRISGTTEPMITSFPPDNKLDLRTALTFTVSINDDQHVDQTHLPENILYISDNALDPPIVNSIHLNIAYSGQQPLATGWTDQPQFTVFFTYGLDDDDLTDDIQSGDTKPPQPYNELTSAWNIGSELSGDLAPYWNLQKPLQNTGEAYPVWILQPFSTNHNLFTNQLPSLDLSFSHVISRLGAGDALIYVSWNHIPGYFDGALVLTLSKQVFPPQIISLECANPNQQSPEALQLSWKIFAAKTMRISWDDGLQSKAIDLSGAADSPTLVYDGSDSSIVPDRLQTTLVFKAENSNGDFSEQRILPVSVQDLPAPNLSQFQGVYQFVNGNWQIAFSWVVQDLGEYHYFSLNGQELPQKDIVQGNYTSAGYPFSYVLLLNMPVVPSSFTLNAINAGNNKTGSISVTPQVDPNYTPQISNFTATLERDSNKQPRVQLSATMNQVLDNARVYVTSRLGTCTLSLDAESGTWNGYQPVNDGSPVQNDYILHAGNLANGPENSSRLQTGFSVAQEITCWPELYMPIDMVLSPDKQRVYVLSSDGNFIYSLSYFDPENIDSQTNIVSFNVYQFGYFGTNPPDFSLSVAPDDSQVMLTASELIVAVVLSGSDPGVMLVSKVLGGMEARFANLNNIIGYNGTQLYLFNPDSVLYPFYKDTRPYGFKQFNAGSDTPTYTALAMRPDGQRGFVAAQNGNDGGVYWFDTDPNNTGNPIAHCIDGCNQICGLAMAGNNWMYAIYQGSNNNVQLFAFDTTSGQPYNQSCATAFGVFTSDAMKIAVSGDNSFVAVANYNNKLAWLLTGTWDMNTPPALRQDAMLNQQLLNGCSMVFARDNSRLFVAGFESGGNACILVLEPVFS
jgi:hypothetical protein